MKGDFSRYTGLKATRKHYSGVLKQQGRVQLDSDWNELISIIAHQRGTRTIDIVGKSGAPIHASGFKIFHPATVANTDFLIAAGRYYVDGLLCESTPGSKLPVTGISTTDLSVDDFSIDGIPLIANDWVQLASDEDPDGIIAQVQQVNNPVGKIRILVDASALQNDHHLYLVKLIPYSLQPDLPTAPAFNFQNNKTYLIYLDAWQRHITTIEDTELREVALGGPDTDTRAKIVAQVRVLEDVGNVQCGDDIAQWNDLIKIRSGRLTVDTVASNPPPSPCDLGETGGYHGLENHLYRVEIHGKNTANGKFQFKWSRDNGAYAYPIAFEPPDGAGAIKKIRLIQNGKDEVLKIKNEDRIEISGDETDLDARMTDDRKLGTIATATVSGNNVTLDKDVIAHKDEANPKVRRWDTSVKRTEALTDIDMGTAYELEDGIQITFSGNEFNAGDYWVFSARALKSEVEKLQNEPHTGVKHHYSRLAIVNVSGTGVITIEDCRNEFHPLTELQEGCCTVTVGKNGDFQDIQKAIDYLKGGPGNVCIHPGTYELDSPLDIVNGNNITIEGCGGTPILLNRTGILFDISNSNYIKLQNLWCASFTGTEVIEAANTTFLTVEDCFLVAAGSGTPAGVVTCRGLTVQTNVRNNLILGRTGIRYAELGGTDLHINTRVENNLLFVLESGVFQEMDAMIRGLDLNDNIILGFGQGLVIKSFFPAALFSAAQNELFAGIALVQDAGPTFESVARKNEAPLFSLREQMMAESETLSGTIMQPGTPVPSSASAVLNFPGIVTDANFMDNVLGGKSGISVGSVLESGIESNIILALEQGIVLGTMPPAGAGLPAGVGVIEALSIRDNFIGLGGAGAVAPAAIKCTASVAKGLSVAVNRLRSEVAGGTGVRFEPPAAGQQVTNLEIAENEITADANGIAINDNAVILGDFSIADNTIRQCTEGGVLINCTDRDVSEPEHGKRMIAGNSIAVKGDGVKVNIPETDILENDINILSGVNAKSARGIILQAPNCTVKSNRIHAKTEINERTNGGIFLDISTKPQELAGISILRNKIIGGMENGIEINLEMSGLLIEGNEIAGMGLNGIAVRQELLYCHSLVIKGNNIHDCHRNLGVMNWWRNAGIVLTTTAKTQITGNTISNNEKDTIDAGAIFALSARAITISDNQCFFNMIKPGHEQAVIHIFGLKPQLDIQIINNLMIGAITRALEVGKLTQPTGNVAFPTKAVDMKAVIANNNFESALKSPVVWLQVSECVFSGNYVSCNPGTPAVSLADGWFVSATGNVVTHKILSSGNQVQMANNVLLP